MGTCWKNKERLSLGRLSAAMFCFSGTCPAWSNELKRATKKKQTLMRCMARLFLLLPLLIMATTAVLSSCSKLYHYARLPGCCEPWSFGGAWGEPGLVHSQLPRGLCPCNEGKVCPVRSAGPIMSLRRAYCSAEINLSLESVLPAVQTYCRRLASLYRPSDCCFLKLSTMYTYLSP